MKKKLSSPHRHPHHEEPDSRAVSAKAAAGLPQSKESFHSPRFPLRPLPFCVSLEFRPAFQASARPSHGENLRRYERQLAVQSGFDRISEFSEFLDINHSEIHHSDHAFFILPEYRFILF
jgi:hypothetical protein